VRRSAAAAPEPEKSTKNGRQFLSILAQQQLPQTVAKLQQAAALL